MGNEIFPENSRKAPTLPSSFHCSALSFDSDGTRSYVLKQKGSKKCVILKPQTSLDSESFLALFRPRRVGFRQGHVICSSLRMQSCFVQLQKTKQQ